MAWVFCRGLPFSYHMNKQRLSEWKDIKAKEGHNPVDFIMHIFSSIAYFIYKNEFHFISHTYSFPKLRNKFTVK
jgi:hypothetical protein